MGDLAAPDSEAGAETVNRYPGDAHPFEQSPEDSIGHWARVAALVAGCTGKDYRRIEAAHLLQNRERIGREWDAVRYAPLHPLAGYDPSMFLGVDLFPSRFPCLDGTDSR
jgi:hypothetical protein